MIFVDILVLDHKSKVDILIKNKLLTKKEKLKDSVEDTILFLETEYKRLQLTDKKKPDIKILLAQLKNYNFLNDCEIIIFNDKPKVLYSNYSSNIILDNLFGLTDNNQKKFIKELYDKVKNQKEGDFTNYSWDRPYKTTLTNNKLQYGKYSKLLKLTVTSHQFIDDIQMRIDAEENFLSMLTYKTNIAMGVFFLSILTVFFLFIFYMVKKLQNNYEDSVTHFLDEIKKDAHVIEDDGRLYGFGKIIAYFNKINTELIECHKDIDKLKYKLKESSTKDYLSGFANRDYFYAVTKEVISISKREDTPISLAILGIENFQNMREKYGYQITDEVIKDLSKILKFTIRESDIVSRLSDDKFALFLYNTPYNGSLTLLNRLQNKIDNHKAIIIDKEISYSIYFSSIELDYTKYISLDDAVNEIENNLKKS